ncbi:Glutamyl-tRNA(Gln) amidotransferase subunit A [Pseudoalteromonas sp. CIP111854]|uniref:Glutamyl-tRNA(Gln) amidotransferase subunit A n=1 Tax=Pseudoalteromonas holothuriae TaxID=2963714 RepID=A0A9W4R1L2_9GAMM|nr:amidase [Pseudoalteromonas sp. CIP111854]CAH9062632.1 Glutamyl-tRNA(Gln) amidotransferase subunit A [Pseudoalteromonas sp. CIP111854]
MLFKKYSMLFFSTAVCALLSTNCLAQNNTLKLEEYSLSELQQLVDQNQLSYQQITQFYLSRIDELDVNGPKLNAIINVNQQALMHAKQKDAEHDQNTEHSLLYGMPIVLKDNIETAGNTPTTAGAVALEHNYAQQDAELVTKLKKAGAIILGKANLSEWANFKSTHSSSGWSDVGGQTKNPYVLNRTPCGSSSGSAVAVAANLAVVAVGTETDGSITCPAAHNSLVGLKPTVGLVSGKGIVPLSHSQDAAGPMTRSVQDAAVLLEVMADTAPNHYQKHLNKDGLKGKRIGIARNVSDFNPVASQAFEQAITVLKIEGAIVVDNLTLEHQNELSQAEFDILLYDFKHDVNEYLANTPEQVKVKSLEQLIAFNTLLADSYFNQGLFEMAQQKGGLESEAYITAKKLVADKARTQGIDALMEEHKLDAIVAPTNGPAWVIDTVNGDQYTGASSSPAAIAGYPSITVPMAFYRSLPLGISFFSTAHQEGTLIEIGYAFEQATKVRRSPKFISSIDE